MQRLFAGISLLAVLAGAGYGGYRWYRTVSSSASEATAVLQMPHEFLTRGHLFDQNKGETDADYLLADAVVKGTLTRLADRQVALKSESQNESPRDCLRNHCRVQLDSETGQDRVTLTYCGRSSA